MKKRAAQSAIGSLALGKWYHIVATSTATAVINLYINGVVLSGRQAMGEDYDP